MTHRFFKSVFLVALVAGLLAITFATPVAADRDLADFLDLGKEDDSKAVVLHGHNIPRPGSQEGAIRTMNNRQLRRFLRDRGATCDGCIEKHHLVERALAVRGWATQDDLIASELTPTLNSAATHLALHHVAMPSSEHPSGTIVLLQEPERPNGDVIIGNELCNRRLLNGTQFCHSIAGMQKHARAAMA